VRVRRVYYRNAPIMTMACPICPPSDYSLSKCVIKSAMIWDQVERAGLSRSQVTCTQWFSSSLGVWCYEAGGSRLYLHSEHSEGTTMAPSTNKGIIDKPSNHSVEQTVEKLKNILQSKGVTLFALVDHSGEAEKVGMKMRPTKLLIFGSPMAGTPLMLAAPSSAIDLPLKILIWEDDQGKVWVSYNSPDYLKERHGLPLGLLQNIAVVETLAAKAGE
jgi:uncharacterized protein (DUF302 family)